MRCPTTRFLPGLAAAVLALHLFGPNAYGQSSVNVVASAGAPTPNPVCLGSEVVAALNATVTNPPTGTYQCPIQGPVWSWTVLAVEYRASEADPFAPAPAGSYSAMIVQPASGSADADLIATFSQAGFWQITVKADVSFTSSPCMSTWTGSGTTDVQVAGVEVTFSPDPLYLCQGMTGALTATVTPASASTQVTLDTADGSVATVSGTAPNLTVTGLATGTTQVRAKMGSAVCKTANCTVIAVTFAPDPVSVGVGATAPLTATVTPASAAGKVTFDTADGSIATVTGTAPNLTVKGVAAGTTQVRAKLGTTVCKTATVNVTAVGVTFAPDPLYVCEGMTAALTATVTPASAAGQVTFDTADGTVATVTGAAPNLTVKGVATGTTQVRAKMGSTVLKTATVIVVRVALSPDPLYVVKGSTEAMMAAVTPASAAGQVTFDTADGKIATVAGAAPNLTVTGVAIGTTQVRAKLGATVCAQATVVVVATQAETAQLEVQKGSPPASSDPVCLGVETTIKFKVLLTKKGQPQVPAANVKKQSYQVQAGADSTIKSVTATGFAAKEITIEQPGKHAATLVKQGGNQGASIDVAVVVVFDQPGTKSVSLEATEILFADGSTIPPPANGAKATIDVLVMKVEITDKDGNVLKSPVTAASLATVARKTELKAKVTPADLKGLKYEWTVTGSAIKTYKHRTDIPEAHEEIKLKDEDKNKEDLSFFWTDKTGGGNKTAVTLKVTKDSTTCDATLDFKVKQAPDPGRDIYCASVPETSPNGEDGVFVVRTSHGNWHVFKPMDDGKKLPATYTTTPKYSEPEGGGAKAWGDFDTKPKPPRPDVNVNTNGRAFLRWHRALMESHFKWRDTFHVGAVAGRAPGAPDPPEYLKAAPDINSADRSTIYGYVRLGEFQNEWELGRDVDEPWHNQGHVRIATSKGGPVHGWFWLAGSQGRSILEVAPGGR